MFVNNVARIVFSPVGLPGRRMTLEGQHYSLSGTAAISKMISAMTERTPIALDDDNKVMAALSMTTDPFSLEIGLYSNDSPQQQSSESNDEKEEGGLPSVLYAMNANYRSAASSPSQGSPGEHGSSSTSSPQPTPKPLYGITSADLHNKMPIQSLVSNGNNHNFNISSPPSPQNQLAQMSPFVQVVQPDEGVNETSVLDFFNTANNVNSYDDNALPLTPNGSVATWFRQ